MKKIIFDFDGTIIDVSEKYYRVYGDFMNQEGLRKLKKEDYWNLKKQGQHDSLINGERKLRYMDFFLKHVESKQYIAYDQIFSKAKLVLDDLYKKYDLYLLTLRRDKEVFEAEWKSLGIGFYFKKVWSRSPDHTNASENYNVKIRELVNVVSDGDIVVGDSGADIKSGKALGVKTIGLTCGVTNEARMRLLNPDYILPGLDALTTII